MTILLSTIILQLQMMFGVPPTMGQVQSAVMQDQQTGVIVVVDTIEMN